MKIIYQYYIYINYALSNHKYTIFVDKGNFKLLFGNFMPPILLMGTCEYPINQSNFLMFNKYSYQKRTPQTIALINNIITKTISHF